MGDPLNYFPNFLFKSWRTIGLPDPTPLQYDFAHYLDEGYIMEVTGQAAKGDVGARDILMAFRGASKSYVATDYAVCRARRDRTERILITSATDKFASGIANFAWQMVSNFEWLSDLKPRPDQRRSSQAFDIAGCPPAVKDESFAALSIFGQITGRRASLILGDDLETPNTSDTEGARQELRKRSGEFGAIILPQGDIYLLGTAQVEDTIYRDYAEEKGYRLRIYPILYPVPSDDPKRDEVARYGSRLAPFVADALKKNPELAGTSVEPSRFSEGDILGRRREWGATEFDRQFKMFLDAGAGRGNPLKMRDLVVMEISEPMPGKPLLLPTEIVFDRTPPCKLDIPIDAMNGDSTLFGPSKADIWVPAEEIMCYVDPSGEGKDETTWTIGAGLLGRVYALFQGASPDGHSKEVLDQIAKDCKRWGVQTVKVESNFGQGMFGELLMPSFMDLNWQVAIEEERQGKVMKEARIVETLEPVMTSNRLVVNANLLRLDFDVDYEHLEAAKRRYHRLTYQLSRMVKQKGCVRFDDRADGFSGMVKHFVGMLMRQLDQAEKEGRIQQIEKEVERMIELRKRDGLPLFGLEGQQSPWARGSRRPIR